MPVVFVFAFFSKEANGQIDSLLQSCSDLIRHPYILDGQQYRAFLEKDEKAEFKVTFFGGNTYRIVACEPLDKDKQIVFRLLDSKRRQLFSNTEHGKINYWDFEFKSTVECIIEAKFDSPHVQSGVAILLIGFKRN